jgi:hypothetical protein
MVDHSIDLERNHCQVPSMFSDSLSLSGPLDKSGLVGDGKTKRKSMKVICAWCYGEGKPGLLGEKGSSNDVQETHGICHRHLQTLKTRGPKTELTPP